MAYATVAQLKTYMGGFEDADAALDTHLTNLIARVQAAIDRYCHRSFEASADSTRYFDAVKDVGHGDGSVDDAEAMRTLYLDEDLCAITSITNGDGATIASSKYITLPVNRTPWYAIRLRIDSDVAWTYDTTPEKAIAIVGKWSYSTAAPDDVVHVTLRLTAWIYKQVENYQPGLDRPVVSPDGVMLLPANWPADVLAALQPLRRL